MATVKRQRIQGFEAIMGVARRLSEGGQQDEAEFLLKAARMLGAEDYIPFLFEQIVSGIEQDARGNRS